MVSGGPLLLVADAQGHLRSFRLAVAELVSVATVKLLDGLCLSLDIQRAGADGLGTAAADACAVVVSREDGQLSLLQASASGLQLERSWQAHDMETWITALDCWDRNMVYSGADDTLWRGWDLRQDCQRPVFTSKRCACVTPSLRGM